MIKKLTIVTVLLVVIFALCSKGAYAQDGSGGGGGGFGSQEESITHSKDVRSKIREYEENVISSEIGEAPNLSGYHFNVSEKTAIYLIDQIVPYEAGGSTADSEHMQQRRSIIGDGAIPTLNKGIVAMYRPPASTSLYIADILESAKIVPQARAQGIGFASLDPVMQTWKTFRNVAYLFFVLAILVIGFMIMFRHKIDGQTVVTVQQAVPNIIIALLFVTFSYAIAGLLIDTMYISMYLIIGLFDGSANLINLNFLELGNELFRAGWSQGNQAATETLQAILDSANVGAAIGWISNLTVGVIVALALLFGVFKLFFALLKSYVSIILNVAFAPIILMLGAIPGKNTFGSWLKNIVGNLAAFPTVLIILIVREIISQNELVTGGFSPPYLLNQGVAGALPAIVGIGLLLATPEIVDKVKEAVGAKEDVFGELAGVAGDRLKKSASMAAAPTVGAQLGGLGYGLGRAGGLAKGLLEGQDWEHANQRSKTAAKKWGLGGAMLPAAARYGPKMAKGLGQLGIKEAGQFAINELTGDVLIKWAKQENKRGLAARKVLARAGIDWRNAENLEQDTSLGGTDPSSSDPI